MFCTKCGVNIEDGSTFCPQCGANQQLAVNNQGQAVDPNQKSRLAAGLLQIFLGSFGVGRFYLGYVGIGIAQIAVTWLTCGLGAVWPLIDGIMILTGSVNTDADGRPLGE